MGDGPPRSSPAGKAATRLTGRAASGPRPHRRYRSVPAGALLVRPRGARRAIDLLDVAEAPLDLGGGVGLPVGPGAGHLGTRQRLRDAVGARDRVAGRGIPAALGVPQALQAAELAG